MKTELSMAVYGCFVTMTIVNNDFNLKIIYYSLT